MGTDGSATGEDETERGIPDAPGKLILVFVVLDLELVEEDRLLQPVALAPPRLNVELRHSPSYLAAALSLQELRRAHPQV